MIGWHSPGVENTAGRRRSVVLRDERSGDDSRHLTAELTDEGDLRLIGVQVHAAALQVRQHAAAGRHEHVPRQAGNVRGRPLHNARPVELRRRLREGPCRHAEQRPLRGRTRLPMRLDRLRFQQRLRWPGKGQDCQLRERVVLLIVAGQRQWCLLFVHLELHWTSMHSALQA